MSNISNREIERKYLVASDEYKSLATSHAPIRQGYLSVTPESTVRVRQYGEKAFLTIKGRPAPGEIGRLEWEREITIADFETLFPLCVSGMVEKTRWLIPMESGLVCEVDEFSGMNEGLVLAEVEMPAEDTAFEKPTFLGEEVTSDHRYYNSYLSVHPYTTW